MKLLVNITIKHVQYKKYSILSTYTMHYIWFVNLTQPSLPYIYFVQILCEQWAASVQKHADFWMGFSLAKVDTTF